MVKVKFNVQIIKCEPQIRTLLNMQGFKEFTSHMYSRSYKKSAAKNECIKMNHRKRRK